jgi:L-asparaginase II
MSSFVVRNVRGGIVESVHRVSVVVVGADGVPIASTGDPDFPTYIRSAAKPFQAMPLLEDGAVEAYGVTDSELALACASHNSERRHVETAQGWLERIGCTADDLACGPHAPLGRELAFGPAERSDEAGTTLSAPSRLASNCSGKHTGMLTLARHHGWDTQDYHRPAHPVQRRMRAEMARWSGLSDGAIGAGIDGCGVVAFSLPLRAMALAYQRLGAHGGEPATRVREAMMRHPAFVAGEGRLDTALMRAAPGVVSKVGAEGVYGVSLVERGLGVALKVEDGNARAAVVALVAVLRAMRVLGRDQLQEYARFAVANTRDEDVGVIEPHGTFPWRPEA